MDASVWRAGQAEVLGLLARLMAQASNAPDSGGVRAAGETLGALVGALDAHVERERTQLYPALGAVDDPDLRAAITEGAAELGAVRAALLTFASHWTPAAITADSSRFACAAAVVAETVRRGLERENAGLSPLVDRMARVA